MLLNVIKKLYTGKNLVWQLIACLVTALIVSTGCDWWFFDTLHASVVAPYFFPAVVFGGFIPFFAPPIIILLSLIPRFSALRRVSIAMFTAESFGLGLSSLYKVFTGRIQPPQFIGNQPLIDSSHGFHFGFMQNGVFWGWPSSHTTVTFAMITVLITLFPNNKVIRYLGLAFACYVAIGVSMSIHWLSEGAAGVIFGSIIGITVGKEFLIKKHPTRN